MRVTVIGANGFVGSAFVRLLQGRPEIDLICVTRENFDTLPVRRSDVVIEAACNSKKFIADRDPLAEFELSVTHRLKSLHRFPGDLQVHISSVDVYGDLSSPASTHEAMPPDYRGVSRYGLHKLLAEQLVRHYAPSWLILRLAGMVGTGLRKNPVYDILHGQPLRIHPDSRYQYLNTDEVAQIGWKLAERKIYGEIFNVCGGGLITMHDIAQIARQPLDLSAVPPDAAPRIVEADNQKIRRLFPVTSTAEAIQAFLRPRPQTD